VRGPSLHREGKKKRKRREVRHNTTRPFCPAIAPHTQKKKKRRKSSRSTPKSPIRFRGFHLRRIHFLVRERGEEKERGSAPARCRCADEVICTSSPCLYTPPVAKTGKRGEKKKKERGTEVSCRNSLPLFPSLPFLRKEEGKGEGKGTREPRAPQEHFPSYPTSLPRTRREGPEGGGGKKKKKVRTSPGVLGARSDAFFLPRLSRPPKRKGGGKKKKRGKGEKERDEMKCVQGEVWGGAPVLRRGS